ncbi:MAG: T9SS type A sorting domain-containing protein [Chitinophagales bacterium]
MTGRMSMVILKNFLLLVISMIVSNNEAGARNIQWGMQAEISTVSDLISHDSEIIKNKKKPALTIYPNPSNGIFTISCQGMSAACSILVYDGNDKIIYMAELSGAKEAEINLPQLFRGLASVTLRDESYTISKTVLIL